MALYRKKPVTVEAWQLPSEDKFDPMPAFMVIGFNDGTLRNVGKGQLQIEVLGGVVTAVAGDWIIKGVQGELYPCKADIFKATHEAVEA